MSLEKEASFKNLREGTPAERRNTFVFFLVKKKEGKKDGSCSWASQLFGAYAAMIKGGESELQTEKNSGFSLLHLEVQKNPVSLSSC